jgi:hypothetical protein
MHDLRVVQVGQFDIVIWVLQFHASVFGDVNFDEFVRERQNVLVEIVGSFVSCVGTCGPMVYFCL